MRPLRRPARHGSRMLLPPGQGAGRRTSGEDGDGGRDGEFEPFKTTSVHDGTAHNPAWLGAEPER